MGLGMRESGAKPAVEGGLVNPDREASAFGKG